MTTTTSKVLEVYNLLRAITRRAKGSLVLTGSASLNLLGLHNQEIGDLDFAFISNSLHSQYVFGDMLRRAYNKKIIKINKLDLDEYRGDIGKLIQLQVKGTKTDIFIHGDSLGLSSRISHSVFPILCPVVTYRQKFKTNPSKAKEHLSLLLRKANALDAAAKADMGKILNMARDEFNFKLE